MKNILCISFFFSIILITDEKSSVLFITKGNQNNYLDFNSRLLQAQCSIDNCPIAQGFCNSGKCVCIDGFISIDAHSFCSYKQKQVVYALTLESFGLIGFGHFYAGRVLAGIVKMLCFYIIICYGSQFVIAFLKETSDTDTAYYIKILIST